jgi:sugar/nucleoside kinase (ribokinase family)
MGPKHVVVKKGEHGAMLVDKDGFFAIPAFPLTQVVDPTGAGDSFAGAFIGYVASKKSLSYDTLKQGLVVGTLVSSYTVQDFSLNRLKTVDLNTLKTQFDRYLSHVQIPSSI